MYAAVEVSYSPELALERDDLWLQYMLRGIWNRYFGDTPQVNSVCVSFSATWKSRLGSITLSEDRKTSYIQINALLRYRDVPEFVAQVTIAHEMVHYAHGFGSPLPRRYKYPHRGGVVKRELLRRGMEHEYRAYDNWVYNHWYDFYEAWESQIQDVRPTSA